MRAIVQVSIRSGKVDGFEIHCTCPWGHEELDVTERLHFHALEKEMVLQYSCLENARDRGAWWAAVYGVTQSRI